MKKKLLKIIFLMKNQKILMEYILNDCKRKMLFFLTTLNLTHLLSKDPAILNVDKANKDKITIAKE